MINRHCAAVVCGMLAGLWAAGSARAGSEWKDGRWVRTPSPAAGTAAGEVEQIRQYVGRGKEGTAVKAAEKFLKKHATGELREDAMMLAGQAEFNRGRYYQAFGWFEKLLKEFPNGKFFERALDREYRVGDAFLRGRKRIAGKVFRLPAADEGVEILTRIAEHSPGSALAEKALLRIPDYYYEKGKYTEAAERYDQFLKIFPKSKKSPYVMLQAARATYALYKGPRFDETPLLEALERFKRFSELYPQAAKREKIPELIERISNQQAERLYTTAAFYRRTSKPKSAVFYYDEIIKRYPKTEWADRARRAKAEMAKPKSARPSIGQWLRRMLPG